MEIVRWLLTSGLGSRKVSALILQPINVAGIIFSEKLSMSNVLQLRALHTTAALSHDEVSLLPCS